MIRIVTDSSSYLKKNEAAELGIKVVPLKYSVGSQEYLESFGDQNGDFESILKGNSKFLTSQPSMAAFLSCFEEELSQGNDILCITISSRLSGTFSTAYIAAKQTAGNNIVVFDSQLTAGGLYLLIKEAKKLIVSGKELSEIIKRLPEIRDRITIAFSVGDMVPLRNSGRMGFVRMGVGTFLNIKPILLCKDGAIVSDSTVHGNAEMIKILVSKITANVKEIVVNYIGNSRIATNLYNVIHENYAEVPIKLQKMGPVLGIHLGLQVVAVSFITE